MMAAWQAAQEGKVKSQSRKGGRWIGKGLYCKLLSDHEKLEFATVLLA